MVRELRSHMPQGAAKKKKKTKDELRGHVCTLFSILSHFIYTCPSGNDTYVTFILNCYVAIQHVKCITVYSVIPRILCVESITLLVSTA